MEGLTEGTRFAGRYDIEAKLGEGGVGVVYAARHAFTKSPVALKVLHAFAGRSEAARERFLREAQAPGAIGHPSLVRVLDAGDEGGVLYLAMERLEGSDLHAALLQGQLDPPTLLRIGVEILDGLAAAHAAGLVHRDIKPANVFVLSDPSAAPRVRLLDFGITGLTGSAAPAKKLTRDGALMGTPLYMAPEQAAALPADGRADLWAVGAILFHALSGVPPIDGPPFEVIKTKIKRAPLASIRALRPEVAPALAQVIDKALAPQPEARWQAAASMRDALRQAPAPTTALPRFNVGGGSVRRVSTPGSVASTQAVAQRSSPVPGLAATAAAPAVSGLAATAAAPAVSGSAATEVPQASPVSGFAATGVPQASPVSGFAATEVPQASPVSGFAATEVPQASPVSGFAATEVPQASPVSGFAATEVPQASPVSGFAATAPMAAGQIPVAPPAVRGGLESAPVSEPRKKKRGLLLPMFVVVVLLGGCALAALGGLALVGVGAWSGSPAGGAPALGEMPVFDPGPQLDRRDTCFLDCDRLYRQCLRGSGNGCGPAMAACTERCNE